MFKLNNLPILADEIDILNELKNQLAVNGIYRFNEFRTITNHIQFNCPIHKNGQERSPSCGITTTDIKYQSRTAKGLSLTCLSPPFNFEHNILQKSCITVFMSGKRTLGFPFHPLS